MARFRYKGEKPRAFVTSYGVCDVIRVRCSTDADPSGKKTLVPVPPATEFAIGVDIGHEITDATMLRIMRADTVRFEEIV